jgi:hypothetical protein
MSDIVAELGALAERLSSWGENRAVAERARDEIVALRSIARGEGEQARDIRHMLYDARAEALEDAARVCDDTADGGFSSEPYEYYKGCLACAAAIRALKERP